MKIAARRDAIIEIIEREKHAAVEDLASALDASKETIRRDLAYLDSLGRLQKYHGGARMVVADAAPEAAEGRFRKRLQENRAGKKSIARAAARLFRDGDTLFIDTGSTTVIFAEELARLRDLTVITNSTAIAATLTKAGNRHCVYLIGGEFAPDASETVGALAVEQIRRFNAQHVVLTVGAALGAGIFDFDLKEAEIAKAMLEQAQVATVLADRGKFGRAGVFQVAPMSMIDRLVTDAPLDAPLSAALSGVDVELIVAAPSV